MAFLLLLLLANSMAATRQAQGQQQSFTDWVYDACNHNTYASNSGFDINFNTVVTTLKQRAKDGERHYLTSATSSDDNSTWVYGFYQCRGDLSDDNCRACVQAVMAYYCTEGNAIGMRVQLLGCYYRYENYNFTNPDFSLFHNNYNCSSEKNSSSVYQANLTAALNRTATTAPANNGYSAATVGSAYALSQCFEYLSPSDCKLCLSQSSSRTSICNTSASGYFYYVSCYYLFTDHLLYNFSGSSSTSPVPPPPDSLSSAPAPSNSPVLLPPPAISPSAAHLASPVSAPTNITASPPPAGSTSSSLSVAAIAGIVVGSASALLVVAIFCVLCVLKRRRHEKPITANPLSGSPFKFTVKELHDATESFQPHNKLGQGGFGVVYKGTLRNCKEVAIKVIPRGDNHGKKIDFENEAKLITTVQHRNLIQLLGFAEENNRWYLVYEYFPNRSLDLHLFASNDEAPDLDWKTRYSIITGIARGLCYLHEDSQVRIVHRDVKASNILLDSNLEPKIADFGLARLFADDVSHLTTAVAGTLGYLAPEYAVGGQLSEKVDVYSFGILTLEIVSGRRVIENDAAETHILQWAWEVYERKAVMEMVEKRIRREANEWEVARAVHVALLCTQTKPQARPAMAEIYNMLRSESAILDLPSRPRNVSMGIFAPVEQQQQRHQQSQGHRESTDREAFGTAPTTAPSGVHMASCLKSNRVDCSSGFPVQLIN